MVERPRYSIIGQSNSILKEGYASALGKLHGGILHKNCSLGASPSLIGGLFGTDQLFRNSDLCIFDLCVVDQVFLWNNNISYYRILKAAEALIQSARKNGCQPVFLLLPHEAVVGSTSLGAYGLIKSIAIENGCYFIDVERWIGDNSSASGASVKSFYSDSNHISMATSDLLAELIDLFLRDFGNEVFSDYPALTSKYSYHVVDVCDNYAEGEKVHRENSLFERSFLKLKPNEKVVLRLEQDCCVHGLLVNASQTFSVIQLNGDRLLTKNLCSSQSSLDIPFRAQVVPVSGVVCVQNGVLTIELVDGETPLTETTFQAQHRRKDLPDQVEIAALIVERRNSVQSYIERRPSVHRIDVLQWLQSGHGK